MSCSLHAPPGSYPNESGGFADCDESALQTARQRRSRTRGARRIVVAGDRPVAQVHAVDSAVVVEVRQRHAVDELPHPPAVVLDTVRHFHGSRRWSREGSISDVHSTIADDR